MQNKITSLQETHEFKAAAARFAELQDRLNSTGAEAERIQGEIEKLGASREKHDPLVEEAQKLLSGNGATPAADRQTLQRKLTDARRQRDVLEKAVQLQRARVEQARFRASGVVCEAMRPQHRELVRELAHNLVALGAVIIQEKNFRESLFLADVAFTGHLRAMNIPDIGDPRDQHSVIARWLREAEELRFIGAADIPEEWRKRWASGFDLGRG